MEEKRKYFRISHNCDVLISVPSAEFGKEYIVSSGESVNLSAGGMLLKYIYPIEINKEVELSFYLPNTQKRININGRVLRIFELEKDFEIAIEFININDKEKIELDNLLMKSADDRKI